MLVLSAAWTGSAHAVAETAPGGRTAGEGPVDFAALLAGASRASAVQAETRRSLEKVLDAAERPLDRATAELAYANWLLAVPTSGEATLWVMGLESDRDRKRITTNARDAILRLEEARKHLSKRVPESLDEADRERHSRLRRSADALDAFAALFAAAALADVESERSTFARAALGMAAVREASDAELAACALLWQSFAWELAGRRERSLISLPVALTPPEHLPYDYFSQLLRCRILADSGQHVAASALTIRMQGLAKQWFPRVGRQELQARRQVAALLQYRVGQDWLEQLRATDSEDARAAAERLASLLAGLRDEQLTGEQPVGAYSLEPVVPIVVEPPDPSMFKPRIEPTATSTTPASKPASDPADTRNPTTAPDETDNGS